MTENPLIIKLRKPYAFEGKDFETIDLTAMEDWTTDDMIRIGKKYSKLAGTDVNPASLILPENDLEYDVFIAAEATGLPLEFFHGLPVRDCSRMKTAVINFFYGED